MDEHDRDRGEARVREGDASAWSELSNWARTGVAGVGIVTALVIGDLLQRLSIGRGEAPHQRAVSLMARLVNRAIGIAGVRIEASGLENAKPGTPYIVVSNHQSFLDISLTSDFLEHLHPRYVSKRELAKGVPGVSFNLARGGSALIDRKNPEQAHAAIEALGDRVREAGWTAVIFPEGTRSKTGQIKSFKSAGLRTLVRKAPGVAILPVTTSGGSRLFSRGMKPLIARGTTLRYVVHPPIAAPDPDDDLAFERFVRELQAIIEAELPKAE